MRAGLEGGFGLGCCLRRTSKEYKAAFTISANSEIGLNIGECARVAVQGDGTLFPRLVSFHFISFSFISTG